MVSALAGITPGVQPALLNQAGSEIEGNDQGGHLAIKASIIETVAEIGKTAKPDKIQLVSGLPKTRSCKTMRRILRNSGRGRHQQPRRHHDAARPRRGGGD